MSPESVRRRAIADASRRRLRRIAVVTLALYASGLVVVGVGHAFPPTRLFGLGNASHASITDDVVSALDREFFSVPEPTKTMRKAIDEITKANAAVDDDQFQSAFHFDGENFAGGQSRLVSLRGRIISALGADDATVARRELGSALHTVQDFYSHSNWVELGRTGASPDLGRPGRTIGGVAGPTEPTCDGSTLVTDKLTSGYYGGEDRAPAIARKCRHGGPLDKGPGSGGINKDSPITFLSPHSSFHGAAVAGARAGTEQFIRDLKGEITPKQLRLLLGAGPTLGMSIDTTGSMGEAIGGVKAQAASIVDARLGTDDEPTKYVLAPFNDPSVGPVTVTDDADVFKAALAGLGASGGGDCPELSMSGTLQALSQMDEGGTLFLFTDASAKDGGLAGAVSGVATEKDISVYPIVFGSCSPVDPAYFRLAADTGGQVFQIAQSDADEITALAGRLTASDSVRIATLSGDLTAAPRQWAFPVDSTLTDLTVSVSGAPQVEVLRPDGTLVEPGDPGTEVTTLADGGAPVTIVTVEAPAVGSWTVRLAGDGVPFSLNVTGKSPLDLSAFRLLQEFVGHHGPDAHEVDGLPLVGSTLIGEAVLTEDLASVGFELRDHDGDVVAPLDLDAIAGGGGYAGPVAVPASPFRLHVSGTDSSGAAFERVVARTAQAQTISVTPPASVDLVPGAEVGLEFEVENLGPSGTFVVSVIDDAGFVTSSTPASLELGADAKGTVSVVVQPPADAEVGTSQTLTVDVARADDPSLHNLAVVVNPVVAAAAQAPPVAVAGADATVDEGATVTLDGSASTDPEGHPLTFDWVSVSGPAPVTISGTGAARSVVMPDDGAYVFRLTVSDDQGGESTDEVTYSVRNVAPIVSVRLAYPPVSRTSTPVAVVAEISDVDADTHTCSVVWDEGLPGATAELALDPPADGTCSASRSLAPGPHSARVTVTDDDGGSGVDEIRFVVPVPATTGPAGPAGDPGTDRGGARTDRRSSYLPRTGADAEPMATLALGLLAVGGLLVLVTRRPAGRR